MNDNQEKLAPSIESNTESLRKAAAERSSELQSHPNKEHNSIENEVSISKERSHIESLFSQESSPTERRKAAIDGSVPSKRVSPKRGSKSERNASYRQTMEHVTNKMSPSERTFSKIIHNPGVEKVSEAVGTTIARPNAILAGSFTAFVVVTIIYVLARNMGYTLSGFETIGAFVIGWTLGLIYDYLRIMITGKSS